MNARTKILFICKKRNDFYGPSFGLINSCKFIVNELTAHGIKAKVVVVNDNNDIDREVTQYHATHVFIEALWVVPEKFEELIPLYPKVQWYVRIHSKIPFLANEGNAIHWLREYNKLSCVYPTLHIASNSEEVVDTFKCDYNIDMSYFPNIYHPDDYTFSDKFDSTHEHGTPHHKDILDIGCFGAIRPMKNHLNQAMAAIAFGNKINKKIHFHINSDRCEQKGDNVLKNLIYTFKDTQHKLIFNPWMEHKDFIEMVKKMDFGLQVSLSETFNIVAADFVWNNIPLIGSDEILWLDRRYKANPNSVESIVDKMSFAYLGKRHNIQKINRENLEKYNKKSIKIWLNQI
jgi:hypothetical protein